MARVTFGLFDWIDRGGAPLQQFYEELLQPVEAARGRRGGDWRCSVPRPGFRTLLMALVVLAWSLVLAEPAGAARPFYEPAYVNGTTVTINAIEVKQVASQQAQADFYEVVYPTGWQTLHIGTPQCNPCDHDGNGVDAEDFHDHILDSMPASPGHGEFSPLWHVFIVVPNYRGDPAHDAQVTTTYAAHIPTTSVVAVEALLAATLGDGSPAAVELDTHFYFLCAVIDGHAAP
jgi:hypothetical protein